MRREGVDVHLAPAAGQAVWSSGWIGRHPPAYSLDMKVHSERASAPK
jgi:hypothetical protein